MPSHSFIFCHRTLYPLDNQKLSYDQIYHSINSSCWTADLSYLEKISCDLYKHSIVDILWWDDITYCIFDTFHTSFEEVLPMENDAVQSNYYNQPFRCFVKKVIFIILGVRITPAQPSCLVPFSSIRETGYFYSFSSNKTG